MSDVFADIGELIKSVAALTQLVDVLWGALPADVVIELDPEIIDACRTIHEQLNHSGD